MIDCFASHFVDQRLCIGRRHYHYPIHYFFCLDEQSFNSFPGRLHSTYRIILSILGHFLKEFIILMWFFPFLCYFWNFPTFYHVVHYSISHYFTLHTTYLIVSYCSLYKGNVNQIPFSLTVYDHSWHPFYFIFAFFCCRSFHFFIFISCTDLF